MNLALFFEGTGQGVAGQITNVTRLHDTCVGQDWQHCHLEAGPGTRKGIRLAGHLVGADWQLIFRDARRWFEKVYERLPADSVETKVFLFGFSRGATLARHFASWLDKLGIRVEFLGLWDTVDSILGLDVSEACPDNVRAARHAVARDECRRFFGYTPLKGARVDEQVFPGCHSDVGGLYEDNHIVADVALAWIAQAARRRGLKIRGAKHMVQSFDPNLARLHDSRTLMSNLWGALGEAPRNLDAVRLHRSCAYLLPLER